jgi:hypothetical protein
MVRNSYYLFLQCVVGDAFQPQSLNHKGWCGQSRLKLFDSGYGKCRKTEVFSDRYESVWQQVSELSHLSPKPLELLQPQVASDFTPFFWSGDFGLGGELDRTVVLRSAEVKRVLYGGRVFVIAPIYVTSICQEQCLYCNFRAANKGVGVERRRLRDEELGLETLYLIEQKGLRVLELVYSTDPRIRVDTMCRHVELLRRILDEHGGGLVGISAEAFEENDYRRLVDAGLCWSVLWQETYDRSRYGKLHPGKTKKANFEYRLNAYEHMLAAGVENVGIGVLSGLSDWRRDWAMLMLHEEYLQQQRRDHSRSSSIEAGSRSASPGIAFYPEPAGVPGYGGTS